MVRHGRGFLAAAAIVAAVLGGTTCKVVNEDHCANQDIPGNEFCMQLSTAAPFCSPCRREFRGCVDFEPFACPGYNDEIGDSSGTPTAGEPTAGEPTAGAPTAGTGMGTGPDPTNTGSAGSSGPMSSSG